MQNINKLGLLTSIMGVILLSGCSNRSCCGAGDYQAYLQESPTFITASNGTKYFPYGDSATEEGEAYYYDRSTYYREGVTYDPNGVTYR